MDAPLPLANAVENIHLGKFGQVMTPKSFHSRRGLGSHLIHGSLAPHVHIPNGISMGIAYIIVVREGSTHGPSLYKESGQVVFEICDEQTDRQTHIRTH